MKENEYNPIGIESQLDWPRIRKLLTIGVFAGCLVFVGDWILGYGIKNVNLNGLEGSNFDCRYTIPEIRMGKCTCCSMDKCRKYMAVSRIAYINEESEKQLSERIIRHMKYILFDLDGTITESGTGIINSVKYALKKMNIPALENNVLEKFIGPPLIQSMMKYAGMTADEAQEGLKLYRVYYEARGIFENNLYPGVIELLKKLSDMHIKTAIATSKPEKYAKMITAHFGLDKYLSGVYGATMDEKMVEKSEIIRYAMESIGITEEEYNEVIMVGDRMNDIYGAKENNISSIGVLYGYGNIDELEHAGADYIAANVSDIIKFIS